MSKASEHYWDSRSVSGMAAADAMELRDVSKVGSYLHICFGEMKRTLLPYSTGTEMEGLTAKTIACDPCLLMSRCTPSNVSDVMRETVASDLAFEDGLALTYS